MLTNSTDKNHAQEEFPLRNIIERFPYVSTNTITSKNSTSNFNSFKLLDFRIDESYISLKNNASSSQNNTPLMNDIHSSNKKFSHSASNSFEVNNLSPLITNLPKEFEKDKEKIKNVSLFIPDNKTDSKYLQQSIPNTNHTNSNILINSNSGNNEEIQNQTVQNQNNYNTTGRYLGYFNYFSDKIKENLTNITSNLGINQNMDQKDSINTIEKKFKK